MEKLAEKRAEIFRIFSNAKRVLIFWVLVDGELAVNEIAGAINSSIHLLSYCRQRDRRILSDDP